MTYALEDNNVDWYVVHAYFMTLTKMDLLPKSVIVMPLSGSGFNTVTFMTE